jgi:peptide/nickel transport system permease protein
LTTFVVRRFLWFVPVGLLLLVATFSLIHLTPGSPALAILGQQASVESVQQLEVKLGLDRPLTVQFFTYMTDIVTGQFGESLIGGQPVIELIVSRMPVTLELALLSILLSLVIALPLGILSAKYPGSWIDHFGRFMALAGAAVPTFWFALILVFLFAVKLPLLPSMGWVPIADGFGSNLLHLVMPVFAMALPLAAIESRMLRGELLEVMSQVYIQVARAKGLHARAVLLRHAFRNAILPVITVIGLNMGSTLSGAVIVESIFSLPGMGQLVLNAILQRDYPVLSGTVLFMGAMILLTNLIVDIVFALMDPRIRYS